ncbi:MAG: M48 family metallopeptidase [Candidatus Rokuibacteriota bacterium]
MRLKGRLLPWTLAALLVGCVGVTSSPSGSPRTGDAAPAKPSTSARPVDPAQLQRLQGVMIPLIKGMNRPMPLDKVRVAIVDDDHINAGSAGDGQFLITRGLLEKANDDRLRGVLAHELAHDDLGHVAKTQALGTGVNIGVALLEQIFPGSSAITPLAGQLILNRYTQTEEYAADRHGAAILQRAGHRPELMAETLTWLTQVEGSSKGGFFATHPATKERIEALRRFR